MLMFRNYLNKRKGFTLLELIVVIVILGLLAALAIPTFKSIIAKTQDSKAAFELQALARQNVAVSKFTPDAPHLDNLRVWAESNKENNKSQLDTVAKFNDQTPANTEATLISQMGAASPEYGYYSALLPSDKVSDINLAMRSASGNCVSVIVGNQNASLIKTTVKPYEATGANACTAANANAGEVEEGEEIDESELTAVNEMIQTPQGTPKTLDLREANAVYLPGSLDVLSTTKPANGAARVTEGNIEYTPDADFIGQDRFTYTISNGTTSAKGLVTVDVTEKMDVSRMVTVPNANLYLTSGPNHSNFVYGSLYGEAKFDDNITLTGSATGTGFFSVLNADGTWAWAQTLSSPSDTSPVVVDVKSQGGHTYLFGHFADEVTFSNTTLSNPGHTYFVAKIDAAGAVIWTTIVEKPELTTGAQLFTDAFSIDNKGNVTLTGGFKESVSIRDKTAAEVTPNLNPQARESTYIARLDAEGNTVWLKALENEDKVNSVFKFNRILADNSGNFYGIAELTGSWSINNQTISSNNRALAIVRFDSNGNLVWFKLGTETGQAPFATTGMVRDASGNIYISGYPTITNDENYFTINNEKLEQRNYVLKISAAGNWSPLVALDPSIALVFSMNPSGSDNLNIIGLRVGSTAEGTTNYQPVLQTVNTVSIAASPLVAIENNLPLVMVVSSAGNVSGGTTLSGSYSGQGKLGPIDVDSSIEATQGTGFIVDATVLGLE